MKLKVDKNMAERVDITLPTTLEFRQFRNHIRGAGETLTDLQVGSQGKAHSDKMKIGEYSWDDNRFWHIEALVNSTIDYSESSHSVVDIFTESISTQAIFCQVICAYTGIAEGYRRKDVYNSLFGSTAALAFYVEAVCRFVGYAEKMPIVLGSRDEVANLVYDFVVEGGSL